MYKKKKKTNLMQVYTPVPLKQKAIMHCTDKK